MAQPNSERVAVRASREARRRQVGAMLCGGANYREIARALNVALGTVHGDAEFCRAEWAKERVSDTDLLVNQTLARLDAMLTGCWTAARAGHLESVDRVLKIEAQRAKLLGLDAATRVELAGKVDITAVSLELNVEWIELRAIVTRALGEYPEARQAVVSALAEHASKTECHE